ncbi:MAG TPA: YtxH domain-containing protein [Gemmatimonadales bacterium]|jgi:gas vesicle protein|nr:YtxH domain-containing protein [Gemmatimonadales bacterium]
MPSDFDTFDLDQDEQHERGGLFGPALLALALGAGAAMLFAPAEGAETRRLVGSRLKDWRGGAGDALERVQRELGRREAQRRRQRRTSALMGLAIGAGVAALLTPRSGPEVRQRIADRFRREDQDTEKDTEVDRVVREPQPEPVV